MNNLATPAATPAANAANTPTPTAADRNAAVLRPPVDVIEDSTGITLSADLPGVPRERLQLRVEEDVLLIEAELLAPMPAELTASHIEVPLSRYRRAFTLSKELDADRISAELSNGVLNVRIPKAAHLQPRRIEVQVA